jgi:DNA-binding response OmpR family regulator
VCRALKSQASTAEIPIIMLTARDDVDTRAEGIELGVSEFISKPVLRGELTSRIRAQLDMLAAGRANLETLRQLAPPNRNGSRR